jgi:hypothetical protein
MDPKRGEVSLCRFSGRLARGALVVRGVLADEADVVMVDAAWFEGTLCCGCLLGSGRVMVLVVSGCCCCLRGILGGVSQSFRVGT